jgi:hypothetical protein
MDYRGDRVRAESLNGSDGPHEHRAGIDAGRPTAVQVSGQRLAHIRREREHILGAAFASDQDLAGLPVDVFETEAYDLA